VTWPVEYDLVSLKQVDSTSAEAARRIETFTQPTWITAEHQTAPRGRRGRAWEMPAGNLAATLVLPVVEAAATLALRSFSASLALYDAFVEVSGRPDPLSLKWPNDVLLNGGKVAGILLETLGARGLAIGIGVNLTAAPTPAEVETRALRPVSFAHETGCHVTAHDFLPFLAKSFAYWEDQFKTWGFAPIREAWLARAARLGEPIIARTSNEEFSGTFETVDMTGALVITTSKGREIIPAADVYF